MAITKSNDNNDINYSMSYIRANPTTYKSRDRSLDGVYTPDVSGVNNRYDKANRPLALGSGVYVDEAGRWLLDPLAHNPVAKFVVINSGTAPIYVGINAPSSGSWGIGSGLSLPPSGSYQFGGEGTQIIRNVWAMSSNSSSQLVQGYSTELSKWM